MDYRREENGELLISASTNTEEVLISAIIAGINTYNSILQEKTPDPNVIEYKFEINEDGCLLVKNINPYF